MNTSIECERTLLVQADFDGELDAGQAVALIAHRAECVHCRGVHEQLVRSRALMRAVPQYAVPSALRESIGHLLRAQGAEAGALSLRTATSAAAPPSMRHKSPWIASLGWGVAVAAAVLVTILIRLPRAPEVEAQLVSNHLRALQLDSHLVDVTSSDHHTVKPWFAGKVDFAPVVKELDGEDFVLKGGRIDIVSGRAAAVLVYQAGRHIVDLYMWPASADEGGIFQAREHEGFNLRHWEEGDLTVWCLSDMGASELDMFAQRWRAAK